MIVIHITLRIIKIFRVSVALKLRVSEVSRSKSKTVNTSKNMQNCWFVDWPGVYLWVEPMAHDMNGLLYSGKSNKVKFNLEHTMKAWREIWGIALLFL
jgi:hypothetical protein